MDTNAPPSPPPPPVAPPGGHRTLRRDRANGMLGGVAAGVARTYGIDVLLVRVLFVIAGVLWIGVPAYIVAWIAIPPADGSPVFTPGRRDPKMILGLAMVALGALIAGDRVLPHGFGFGHFGWPLLLIGGGLAILLLRRRDDPPRGEQDDEDRLPPSPPLTPRFEETGRFDETPHVDETGAAASDPPTSTVDEPTETTPVDEPTTSSFSRLPPPPPPPVPPSAWTQNAPWPTVPPVPSARALRRESRHMRRAQRPRSFLTPLTLSVLLIGAGVASLLQATGALDVNLTVVLAIGTAVVGVALVVGAFFGRAHTLILVGLALLGATALANTLDVPLRGGIGDRTYRPVQTADLRTRYELGIGKLELDLRDAPLRGRTTVVDAQTGIGELEVLVPSSVRVEVHAHAGAGSVRLFGGDSGGWPENDDRAIDGTGAGVLRLDLRVGAGDVAVRRFEPGGLETIEGGNG
jgi:phage shock protein PspC (stress-responsive transcriptional regulator)/predicted membrane protein